ncbi:60S ribosomal protein L18a-like [Quercus robur]|uniref:60S ribosomal protein L18a-like n=1 Tax=Quercus robur TaxID=38942 RepID=UPI0021620C9B|nr:60S ribosomal protein L18a-like [Quercus robur]
MAASTGKEIKPRNPMKRKANRDFFIHTERERGFRDLSLLLEMVTFRFHQYQVVEHALPTESDEHPKIYRMKLWATNEVRTKSKSWYFLRKLKKVKKSNGQVLAINEIFEKNLTKKSEQQQDSSHFPSKKKLLV